MNLKHSIHADCILNSVDLCAVQERVKVIYCGRNYFDSLPRWGQGRGINWKETFRVMVFLSVFLKSH